MPDFEKEAFYFVNRSVYCYKRDWLRANPVISYKIDEEESKNQTELISTTDTDPPTSTSSSLPISDETTHKDPSQTDQKIQNQKPTKSKGKNKNKNAVQSRIELMHCDIIKDEFWDARPGLLCM